MENSVSDEEPFWVNPCGFDDEPDYNSCVDDRPLDRNVIKEVLKHSLVNVKVALDDAKKLMEYLKEKSPSIDAETLGDIPLFNFLRFPEAELDAQNSISNIPIAYNCLQRQAVALEQMMKDAEGDNEYFGYLRDEKRSMVTVLCSLYELILHLHLRKYRDVKRAVMPEELRTNVASTIMMRDVIVAKRYEELMTFLCNTLSYCEMIL